MDSIVDILERSGAEIDTDSLFDVILTEAGSNESFVPVEVSGLNLIIPDECQELVVAVEVIENVWLADVIPVHDVVGSIGQVLKIALNLADLSESTTNKLLALIRNDQVQS